MEKRYQVFVSSTYDDLKEERREVIQALLELDFIPSGMEFFPAADDTQWEIIKQMIDRCDYYILILGGRYGSRDKDGMGYTEKEYDYAISQKRPIIPFVHGHPGQLISDKVEKSEAGKRSLDKFRAKVEENRHRRKWTTPDNLGSAVKTGLFQIIKSKPAIGWVRGDQVSAPQLPSKDDPLIDTTWDFLRSDRKKINQFVFTADGKVICNSNYKNATWQRLGEDVILFGYGIESSYIAFRFVDESQTAMEGSHVGGGRRFLQAIPCSYYDSSC
ncbi:MAG: DUF4062 domain-containing protein [Luteolibacter sp.]|uniref:DUF4062 domain-containing protein n=1 Tax=Luteolibacter sp. TaxID=1962973 RepID=UPI0032637B65